MINATLCATAAAPLFGLLTELYLLTFGWAKFMGRNLLQISVNPAAVISGVVFVVLFLATVHGLGISYCRAASAKSTIVRRWRFRWTLVALGIVVVVFLATLSTIGFARHLGWMFSPTDPAYKETVKYKWID